MTTLLTEEDTVAREYGPHVARWMLGRLLLRLRTETGLSLTDATSALDSRSDSKVRKIESGDYPVKRPDVLALMALYGHDKDDDLTQYALDLCIQGQQPNYWEAFGDVPAKVAEMFGLEAVAKDIKIFQPQVIDGLLQTEDYARAVLEGTWQPGSPPIEQQVQLRMRRQEVVLGDEAPPHLLLVLDEAAIRRTIGGPGVMRAQLEHLLEMQKDRRCTVQVVPYGHGAYPGTNGQLTILEFADDFHSPVAYVEGQSGTSYMEKSADLVRCSLTYTRILGAASSDRETAKLIRDAVKDL